ncbi:MAG: hypothetical protein AB7L92_08330 [Alphaproteobacteria bacterium]
MHIFSAIISGIFIALVLGFALSFGAVMLVVLTGIALLSAALFYAQIWWRRWQITRSGGTMPPPPSHEDISYTDTPQGPVIDVEYQDITDKESK